MVVSSLLLVNSLDSAVVGSISLGLFIDNISEKNLNVLYSKLPGNNEEAEIMKDSVKEEREKMRKELILNIIKERKEEIDTLHLKIKTLEEALKGKTKQLLDQINRDRGRIYISR